MKRLLSLLLACVMLFAVALTFAACEKEEDGVKIGVILIGDETEGYSKAHIDGIKAAAAELGIPENHIIWKKKIDESDSVKTAGEQLIADGCAYIFSNSYGHQDYMLELAKKHSDIHFVAMTGDKAATAGLSNYSNAFTNVYESRYVSGVVAGMKLKELVETDKLTEANYDGDNIKIGYVGAYTFAEVISGYTAFYLGVKSVVSNVTMSVQFTDSWWDFDGEKAAATSLINNGCVIIGQHADSAGAPTATQEANKNGKVAYSVGYNVSMLDVAPDAALTSATNVWQAYYKYALSTALKGGNITTNWAAGYADGAVAITDLGKNCAPGTKEKVDEVVAALKNGTLHVFDTSKFTVEGKTVTWCYGTDSDGDFTYDKNNVIADGYYHESYLQSAPSFQLLIDGIKWVNKPLQSGATYGFEGTKELAPAGVEAAKAS
ncbi:MAG: BMP family ABC transporter substrate-binding protein [Oscillospiraceae bacterium]|nr:BMP family ABC transporter substrate-binding protein [Oscillospiraceae bacterium]